MITLVIYFSHLGHAVKTNKVSRKNDIQSRLGFADQGESMKKIIGTDFEESGFAYATVCDESPMTKLNTSPLGHHYTDLPAIWETGAEGPHCSSGTSATHVAPMCRCRPKLIRRASWPVVI